MTYTHCRGCGRKLTYAPDCVDGLCSYNGGPIKNDCFGRVRDWATSAGKPIDFSQRFSEQETASKPAWQVTIDEWLETR